MDQHTGRASPQGRGFFLSYLYYIKTNNSSLSPFLLTNRQVPVRAKKIGMQNRLKGSLLTSLLNKTSLTSVIA